MATRSPGGYSPSSTRSGSLISQASESSPRLPVENIGEGLGLTALVVNSGDEQAIFLFVSDSIQEILGYRPEDLLGKSAYLIFHPDEIPYLREIHYRDLTEETTATVAYMRLLHHDGYFVEGCVSYSTCYGHSIATYTRAEDGPRTIQQALTAREVIEVSPSSKGKWGAKRWTQASSPSGRPKLTSSSSFRPEKSVSGVPDEAWQLHFQTQRTFFFIDRFTDTSRVIFTSNDVICNTSSLKNHSFYSIVKPSDRSLVRQYIDCAKSWSPVVQNEKRSGGHGYCKFSVLKIPDLPAHGEAFPRGTDESERTMPGQEFIPVEGIFTASSDGLSCVLSRIKGKNMNR